MEPLIALLAVVTVVITILLVIVGVYVILILRQFRETLTLFNTTLKKTDTLINSLTHPFDGMGNMVQGMRQGLKVANIFITWLKENKHDALND